MLRKELIASLNETSQFINAKLSKEELDELLDDVYSRFPLSKINRPHFFGSHYYEDKSQEVILFLKEQALICLNNRNTPKSKL
jgi:hypothetical protein